MKQFIILAVSLPMLLLFVVQNTTQQMSYMKISYIDDCVYQAKEEAKQRGCFSDDIIGRLIDNIALMGIEEDKLNIRADESVKYRGETIDYTLEIEVGEAMAGASFFGISPEDNKLIYRISGFTPSEVLETKP